MKYQYENSILREKKHEKVLLHDILICSVDSFKVLNVHITFLILIPLKQNVY